MLTRTEIGRDADAPRKLYIERGSSESDLLERERGRSSIVEKIVERPMDRIVDDGIVKWAKVTPLFLFDSHL